MPTVNGKTFPYTIEGMKKAESLAANTTQRVDIDRSVYGPTNANPNMNPDSNTLLTRQRDTSKRRKVPGPYSVNRNLT